MWLRYVDDNIHNLALLEKCASITRPHDLNKIQYTSQSNKAEDKLNAWMV